MSRVVKEMAQRGWLHHKPDHQRDFVLTGLGRAVLFGEPLREEMHTDMLVSPQPTKVVDGGARIPTHADGMRRSPCPGQTRDGHDPWPEKPSPEQSTIGRS